MTRPYNPYVSQGYGQHVVDSHTEHANDLDSSKDAHHHSIGRSSYQSSSGLHRHDGVDSEQIAYTDLSGLPVIPTLPVTSEVEVFLNGTQNLPNSTWTGIVFNQSVVVTGSALSVAPSNNGILVNTAGRYLIHAATMFSPNASGRRGITVNPSSPAAFAPQIINGASPTSTTYMVFSTILTCTAGLQLTVFMFQDSGVVLTAGNVRLNMYLLY